MPNPLRLLLVDDSIAFLEALMYALRACPHLAVVGCAESGHEALGQMMHVPPDVVVMDIAMPGMNGLEATRHIKAQPQALCRDSDHVMTTPNIVLSPPLLVLMAL